VNTRRLFAFPDPVNEVSARTVAAGVVILCLTAIATGQAWITLIIAYGFLARVATGPTLSPLGQLATRVITPRLGIAPRYVPGPPRRSWRSESAARPQPTSRLPPSSRQRPSKPRSGSAWGARSSAV
jgi:hypothetical protein